MGIEEPSNHFIALISLKKENRKVVSNKTEALLIINAQSLPTIRRCYVFCEVYFTGGCNLVVKVE
jgi:hypothetical protein